MIAPRARAGHHQSAGDLHQRTRTPRAGQRARRTRRAGIEETANRGHAAALACRAMREHVEVVIALGGDGTVNEVVNGVLTDGLHSHVPSVGIVPVGSTNVFARALGLPEDPVEATDELLEALRTGRRRLVSLGRADDRWFAFAAGMGFDAAVVGQVEHRRGAVGARRTCCTSEPRSRSSSASDRRRGPLTSTARRHVDQRAAYGDRGQHHAVDLFRQSAGHADAGGVFRRGTRPLRTPLDAPGSDPVRSGPDTAEEGRIAIPERSSSMIWRA